MTGPETSDQVLLWVVLLTAILPCIEALAEGGPFGAQFTLGLMLVALPLIGLAHEWS